MHSKDTTMINHLLNWKLSDLVDSYNIDLSDDDIEVALNELIEHLLRDIKENNYVY